MGAPQLNGNHSMGTMLPAPATFYQKGGTSFRPRRGLRDTLLTRARVTNLGLCLLAATTGLSLLVNLGYYFSGSHSYSVSDYLAPYNILGTVEYDTQLQVLDHLVIVPGHAIWKGTSREAALDDDSWYLEPFQRGGANVQALYSHISRGVDITLDDEHALLVFSGGQTKKASTTTEGESYLRLAQASGLLPSSSQEHFARVTTEDDALDSFENLLFSIARFHEYTGHYPSKITIVGFEIKRRRFTELHRAALRWPEDRFHYIGIDVEGQDLTPARNGERQNGFLPYSHDTYGCHDFLLSKRRSRNPFNRFHPYLVSSPELAGLFNWCPGRAEGGQTALYPGPLPWDKLN